MYFLKVIIFLLAFSFANLVAANELVRLSTGEWPPFISETLDQKGMVAQLAKEAFATVGIDVKLGFFPWARATEVSKAGEWDGTIALVRLREREKVYFYSDVLYSGVYAFFHLKSFPFSWKEYSDLSGITIATTRGYGGMGDKFIDAEKNGVINVLRLTSDTQSFNMLYSGRVQAVPSDLEVGYVYLHKIYGKDVSKFTHSPRIIQKSDYHLVISKKVKNGSDLIAKFNKGLKLLKESGRYDEIVKSWYEKPIYKESLPSSWVKSRVEDFARTSLEIPH